MFKFLSSSCSLEQALSFGTKIIHSVTSSWDIVDLPDLLQLFRTFSTRPTEMFAALFH